MTTKYETEIEEITAQRAALAARMNELVKMKDMEKTLKSCEKDGHVWTLTTVGSDLWNVWNIGLVCTRCNGTVNVQVDPNSQITWDSHEIEVLKTMLE